MSDHQWTSRVTSWTAFVEHADGTRLQPVSSRVGETDEDVARRVAAALNGTADLTALTDAWKAYMAPSGGRVEEGEVFAAVAALVASTGTETDDAR